MSLTYCTILYNKVLLVFQIKICNGDIKYPHVTRKHIM